MRGWRSRPDLRPQRPFALLLGGLLAAGLLLTTPARADIQLRQTRVQLVDEQYQFSARFSCALNPTLEDALRQGVPLYFKLQLEVIQPRHLWFDKTLVDQTRLIKLSYYALTRQYRLNFGGLYQGFLRLEQALDVMCNPSAWAVLDKGAVKEDGGLEGRVRLALDTSQLPKPFQVSALTSRDWTLDSDWQSFRFGPDNAAP